MNLLYGNLQARWDAIANPGGEHTENALNGILRNGRGRGSVLNCAIPLTRALSLTEFTLPVGLTAEDCISASATGVLPASLLDWKYQPKIGAVPQLPHMKEIPAKYRRLHELPWFDSQGQAAWLGINARHLRYHHDFWRDLKPKLLRGVHTTLVTVTPQIGFALTPHIQLEKAFLYLGSLARGLCPVQLFPARYLFPDARLGDFADAPCPIFADILPATCGYAWPVLDTQPNPWRVLTHYENTDRYYGYPFHEATDSERDFILNDCEHGSMLLPHGKLVRARNSKSYVYATLDPKLRTNLKLNRDAFELETGLLRGTVTHDGFPFRLPVEMQSVVYAIVFGRWELELDRPGDLSGYRLKTWHAAVRAYNFYQRIEPHYSNFMRAINDLTADADFKSYPLSNHLTHSWLGGNLQLPNQLSGSEREFGSPLMRHLYLQQLDWQSAVSNLMNHVSFRAQSMGEGLKSLAGSMTESRLQLDGLAFHQLNRMIRFDSHLFSQARRRASFWPNHHSGFFELDRKFLTESLPKL